MQGCIVCFFLFQICIHQLLGILLVLRRFLDVLSKILNLIANAPAYLQLFLPFKLFFSLIFKVSLSLFFRFPSSGLGGSFILLFLSLILKRGHLRKLWIFLGLDKIRIFFQISFCLSGSFQSSHVRSHISKLFQLFFRKLVQFRCKCHTPCLISTFITAIRSLSLLFLQIQLGCLLKSLHSIFERFYVILARRISQLIRLCQIL